MAAAEILTADRTYGNYRRPVGGGMGSLGPLGTILMLAGLIVVIISIPIFGMLTAGIIAGVGALFFTSLIVRDKHHRTGLQRIGQRAGYRRARKAGHNLYRSGPLGQAPWGTCQLPGLAAASTLTEWQDSFGFPFALLRIPSTNDYTVVFATSPDGASLVDNAQIDSWVAHWGGWLAELGDEPGVIAASVTVETAPDSGQRLRREVQTNLDPDAPDVALRMLAEIVDTYPVGSATVKAYVALTFSSATGEDGQGRRTPAEVGRDLATRLPNLRTGLQATGAGAVRSVSAQELCEIIRTAYDPAAAQLIDEARAAGDDVDLRWPDVGPVSHTAKTGHYRHEGAVSTTWTMSQAPRGDVYASVLGKLLAPHPAIDRKRVTMLYRPLDSGRAADIVEADKRNADFRVKSASRPSARALADQQAADQSAKEEARGAGLVNFGMVVTATVLDTPAKWREDEDEEWRTEEEHTARRVKEARSALDNLRASARIRFRRVDGSQDSAFAAALPLGLVISKHLRVPTEIREGM